MISKSSVMETALTHSTYAYENRGIENNERLEFLGDAVYNLLSVSASSSCPANPKKGK